MGRQMSGKGGEDLLIRVPVGTVVINIDTDEEIGDLDRKRRAPAGRARRARRQGQHPLQEFGQSRAAQVDAGQRRRGARAQARAESARRCRPARLSERRQVDADPRGLGRDAESRRLSVHDAAAASWRRAHRDRQEFRDRRHSGPDRRRGRRRRARHPVPEAHRAHAPAAACRRHGAVRRCSIRSSRSARSRANSSSSIRNC